jgi:hypothetical protein
MRLLALPVLVLALASAASANVLWRGDFETGDLSQWAGREGLISRLTVVQSPVRQGKYALRTELHQGDVTNSGTRNEVENSSAQFNEVEGNDRWYAWSTMFAADFPAPNTWQVFTQWHHSGLTGSPPVEFDVLGETIQLAHNGGTVLWRAPLVRNVWHDFVFHVLWSSTNGYVELYYDGTKVVDRQAVPTLNPGQYAYLKQGLYRDASIVDVGVVYHDGMVMGTTLADVAPSLAAPPSGIPDSGTPQTDAGAPDAGTPVVEPVMPPPAQDAGVPVRSASTAYMFPGGCSHASRSAFTLLGLLAATLFVLRRRRPGATARRRRWR